jgi:phage terminase small subunit
VLQGNPGKRPFNAREPKPPAGDVIKPATLSQNAVGIWEEMAPICVAMGTLTIADRKAFATFCELQATLELASASKGNPTFQPFRAQPEDASDPASRMEIVIDAVLKLERDTAAALRPYYEKFGLEPVGRARISVQKPQAPKSKWEGALA